MNLSGRFHDQQASDLYHPTLAYPLSAPIDDHSRVKTTNQIENDTERATWQGQGTGSFRNFPIGLVSEAQDRIDEGMILLVETCR